MVFSRWYCCVIQRRRQTKCSRTEPLVPYTTLFRSFAESERVLGILWDSGWSEIAVEPLDIECSFPASALVAYVTRLGPLGIFRRQADAAERERIVAAEIGRAHV